MKTFFDLLKSVSSTYSKDSVLSSTIEDKTYSISYEEFLTSVDEVASFLILRGFKTGEKAVIMLESSPSWLFCDLGIAKAGMISVPMFSNLAFENMLYQFENCEAKIIFIENDTAFHTIKSTGFKFDLIISLKKFPPEALVASKDYNVISLDEVREMGRDSLSQTLITLSVIEKQSEQNDIFTIIYTSGTSGKPKGVELTHKNLISQINAIDPEFGSVLDPKEDSALAFLPLAHIFQRMVSYYLLFKCITCHFVADVKHVAEGLEKFKPAVVAVVPRFLEKVKNGLAEKISKEPSIIKKIIAKAAFKHASNAEPGSLSNKLFGKMFDSLMYSKIRKKMGGKIKIMLTGGAGVPDEVYRFFINIGVPLYQGYGLTETSPIIAVNTLKAHKIYTVGKSITGVEVKLGAGGELLVKGPNVMKGYHNVGSDGARDIDGDGFLKTGDIAEIDSEGYIKIIGRKKEQFKTSNGKFINPVKIEGMLNSIRGIETSCIIAEGRPFVTTVLFPNEEGAKDVASLEAALSLEIKNINEKLDRHEHIHYFYLHSKPATIDSGLLTPSLKIIRNEIIKQFKDPIEDFYSRFH